jgi:hypothetical protein
VCGVSVVTFSEVKAEVFRFREAGYPCIYWSNGEHIVADGVCRCGVRFVIMRKEEK